MITFNPICKIGLTNKKPTERGEREAITHSHGGSEFLQRRIIFTKT